MSKGKKTPRPGNHVALEDGDVKPVPPPILSHVRWILVHARNHKLLVFISVLFLVGIALSKQWVVPFLFTRTVATTVIDAQILRLANELRQHFNDARNKLEASGTIDFSDAENDVRALFKLDADNGFAWYYSGEIKRSKDTARFTPKSCLRVPLSATNVDLDAYENDFYRYLDYAASLPVTETVGDIGGDTCYKRPKGYCPQRTAWIHHLLASDLYAEALAASDPKTRVEKLKKALDHANAALKLYPPDGFIQCNMPTTTLTNALHDALKVFH
jgi:hypothetical protein